MIYRLRFDRSRFLAAEIWPDDIAEKLGNPFILDSSEHWSDFWKPLNIKFHDLSDKENVLTPPDITLWFTDQIICNAKAYEAIGEELVKYGEWLPVFCEGIPYWLLHVTKKTGMDAVDQDKSSRAVDETGFADMQSLVFNEEKVSNLLIFKTEYSDYRNIYCTEKFKALVSEGNLEGLLFSSDLTQKLEP